ncbi:MAG: hypothetical protein ACXWYD_13835, partial [Candidatus Binatia bacterium]
SDKTWVKYQPAFRYRGMNPLATKGDVQPLLETPAILCPQQAAGNIRFKGSTFNFKIRVEGRFRDSSVEP